MTQAAFDASGPQCKTMEETMAYISDANLKITHDHRKKLATPVVTCKVHFTPLELCMMKSCSDQRHFRLKCKLWADDSWIAGGDNVVWAYGNVFYFPDPTPAATEAREFKVTVGEGVLDEDSGWFNNEDEIYGKLYLTSLLSGATTTKKTNTVHHHF